jgi:hypothetical protein
MPPQLARVVGEYGNHALSDLLLNLVVKPVSVAVYLALQFLGKGRIDYKGRSGKLA